ncbi:MAG: hypothetical protein WC644_06795 [Ignavibacteria bacterium]
MAGRLTGKDEAVYHELRTDFITRRKVIKISKREVEFYMYFMFK